MALVKSLLIKNNLYNGVRMVIQGSQSSDTYYYYTEASGDRFYFTSISGTQSPSLESASFRTFFSMTQSSTDGDFTYDLIPMSTGNSVMIETKVVGVNGDNTKYYMMKSFGGFVHDGTNLDNIGMNYEVVGNFVSGGASFSQSGTSSVKLTMTPETSETIDWDIHIYYTKGFHTVSGGGGSPLTPPVIYTPSPNNPTS
jgi:hypothetical protein